MANASRPVAPARKLIAAVLGTVAAFVTLFGLGMTSFAIVALGVAVMVLAAALVTVRGSSRAWVIGIAHVHSASEPPTTYAFGRCELQVVIDAPGMPTRSRKMIESRVPVAKWPTPGQTLPIKVALDDPRRVRILWDEVPTHAEVAAAAADLSVDNELDPIDEVLIDQDAPPWAQREPDDDSPYPPGDPYPPSDDPVPDDLSGLPDDRQPVVVRQTPGGPIVLEGTLVGAPPVAPLPRRPTTAQARAEEHVGTLEEPVDFAATVDPLDVPLDEPYLDPPAQAGDLIDAAVDPDVDAEPAARPPINGVGITLLVTDLARSVAFYRDLLGFVEVDGGDQNALLAFGATRLVLREITEAAPINRRLVHVNLEVDDIEAAYERLRAEGVRFTYAPRVVSRGAKLDVWGAAFRDPDGHGIALTQWRDRSAG